MLLMDTCYYGIHLETILSTLQRSRLTITTSLLNKNCKEKRTEGKKARDPEGEEFKVDNKILGICFFS